MTFKDHLKPSTMVPLIEHIQLPINSLSTRFATPKRTLSSILCTIIVISMQQAKVNKSEKYNLCYHEVEILWLVLVLV